MSVQMKSVLIYIGGVVTGIVLTIGFLLVVAMVRANNGGINDDIVLFEQPQQEIKAKSFRIFQVLPNGCALAHAEETDSSDVGYMTVLFLADEGYSYYDEQVLHVPAGQRARQIGAFRYTTRNDFVKTVPVVGFLAK